MATKNRLSNIEMLYEKELMSKQQVRKSIAGDDLSPLDLMLAIIRDPTLAVSTRLDAAKSAAPFLHQKKALAIEGTDKPLFDVTQLRGLSREELMQFQTLLGRAGIELEDGAPTSH